MRQIEQMKWTSNLWLWYKIVLSIEKEKKNIKRSNSQPSVHWAIGFGLYYALQTCIVMYMNEWTNKR